MQPKENNLNTLGSVYSVTSHTCFCFILS